MSAHQNRLIRALSKRGLIVTRQATTYTVKLKAAPQAPRAHVLLPDALPVEGNALHQLASLAATSHPDGGRVTRAIATPDFHPGHGIAIGSVVEMEDMVIPAAVGGDINCGMRLHVLDIPLDTFMAGKDTLIRLLKGDYLLGTRDIPTTQNQMAALLEYGLPSWLDALKHEGSHGRMKLADPDQLQGELDRVFRQGSLWGNTSWTPDQEGVFRSPTFATIGGGNHFVEVQRVDEVLDRAWAHAWGIKEGQVAFMIHSGSRTLGKSIGSYWQDKAKDLWPKGLKHPASGIFPIIGEHIDSYLCSEGAAANYGFANRLLLAEIMRWRLREVYGPTEAPLVYDIPHNITLHEQGRWVTRKGACPAYAGEPVIIPGSMGSSSYLMVGMGNDQWLSSASHGAGRANSRFQMGRKGSKIDRGLEGVECITLREERRKEEAPAAYKPIQPVIDVQVEAGNVAPVARLSPLFTFKA